MKQLVLLFFLWVAFHPAVQAQNYDPNFFPIGVWSVKGDFRSIDDYLVNVNDAAPLHEALFSDLENRGFNAAYMSLDPIGYTIDTILDIALTHNIKVISSMQHLYALIGNSNNNPPTGAEIKQAIINDSINLLKNNPAVLGYYLYDEPLAGWIDFDILAEAKDSLLSLSGGNHPILSTWNDIQQMEYIDSYVNLDVLMADSYPFSDSTSEGSLADYMPAYFSGYGDPNDPSTIGPATPAYSDYIEQIRQDHCNATNRPFWIVFQSFGDAVPYDADDPEASWAYWRQVQPKEIRLQAWIALMQGAKGLWYFLYESEYPNLLGMLDISGQPTQRLVEATAINTQVNKISSILLKLDIVEDAQVSVNIGEIRLHDDLSANTNDKYVIITNTDYFNANDIQVTIPKSDIGYEVQGIRNEVSDENISFTETATEISFVVSLDRSDGSLYHISAQPLPIEMITFAGYKRGQAVALKWETASEVNFTGFDIERSTDGFHWKSIGFVASKGNSLTQNNYQYLDHSPLQGINYYRLKELDKDGQFKYSNTISVQFERGAITIYPNPTHGQISIKPKGIHINKVMIYNQLGQLSFVSEGSDTSLDISNLPKGIYTIMAQSKTEIFKQLVILE